MTPPRTEAAAIKRARRMTVELTDAEQGKVLAAVLDERDLYRKVRERAVTLSGADDPVVQQTAQRILGGG